MSNVRTINRHFTTAPYCIVSNTINAYTCNDHTLSLYVNNTDNHGYMLRNDGLACPLTSEVNKRNWFSNGEIVECNATKAMVIYIYANDFALLAFEGKQIKGGMLNNNSTYHLRDISKI